MMCGARSAVTPHNGTVTMAARTANANAMDLSPNPARYPVNAELRAQIERIKALLPKITSGEWSVPAWPNRQPPILGAMLPLATTLGCTSDSRPNAEFIALARNAMPSLIAELERLEKDLADETSASRVLVGMNKAFGELGETDERRIQELEAELARYRQRAPGMDAGLTLDLGEGKLREDGE